MQNNNFEELIKGTSKQAGVLLLWDGIEWTKLLKNRSCSEILCMELSKIRCRLHQHYFNGS